jgi:hypothetical protein
MTFSRVFRCRSRSALFSCRTSHQLFLESPISLLRQIFAAAEAGGLVSLHYQIAKLGFFVGGGVPKYDA